MKWWLVWGRSKHRYHMYVSCQVFLFYFIGLYSSTGISINYLGLISFFFHMSSIGFPDPLLFSHFPGYYYFLHKSFRFDLSESVFSLWDWIKYINSGKIENYDIDFSFVKTETAYHSICSGLLCLSVVILSFITCWKYYFFSFFI